VLVLATEWRFESSFGHQKLKSYYVIVQCPACNTRYLVPAAAIGAKGRVVRCTKCKHQWFFTPPTAVLEEEAALPPPPPPDIPYSPKQLPVTKTVRQKKSVAPFAIAASVLAFMMISLLAALPSQVVAFWPPSVKLYALAGIAPPLAGEQLVLVQPQLKTYQNKKGQTALLINATVHNPTAQTRTLPPVHVKIYDSYNTLKLEWLHKLPKTSIKPGENIFFYTQDIVQKPFAGRLDITFAAMVQ
jgi:predicted Zn finger-like uncharacterized protein